MEIIKDIIFSTEAIKDDIEYARFIKEGDNAIMHYRAGDEVVMSIYKDYKLTNTIRTNWKGINPFNARTQINGESQIKDLDKTAKNKEHVVSFIKNIAFAGASTKLDEMDKYISSETYFQHNFDNGIGDGLEDLKFSVKEMTTRGSDLKYDELDIAIAQGNLVFTRCIQHWNNPQTNEVEDWEYYDIFRVEDGLIVEHWDIIGRMK